MIRFNQIEKDECASQLGRATMILLLVSADFFFQRSDELDAAMRQVRRDVLLIPVRIRPCDLGPAPFGGRTQLPRNGKPISQWTNADEAWAGVVQEIRNELVMRSPPAREQQRACWRRLQRLGHAAALPLTTMLLFAFLLPNHSEVPLLRSVHMEQPERVDMTAANKKMPRYKPEFWGDESLRGSVAAPQQCIRLSLDSTLDVRLRPEDGTTEAVEATIFIKAEDGLSKKWPVKFERHSSGMLRVKGRVRDFPGMDRPGSLEMMILIHFQEDTYSTETVDWVYRRVVITAEPSHGRRNFAPLPSDEDRQANCQ